MKLFVSKKMILAGVLLGLIAYEHFPWLFASEKMIRSQFANKRVVVTGASDGIGVTIALDIAKQGPKEVVICGRNLERLTKTKDLILDQARNVSVKTIIADFTKQEDLENLVKQAGEVDILVNNACADGIMPFMTDSMEHFDLMMQVNARAPIYLTKAFLEGMVERGYGHIVTVGSMAARLAFPDCAVYSATKAAVEQLQKALASEFRNYPNIHFSVVSPGIILDHGFAARVSDEAKVQILHPAFGGTTAKDCSTAVIRAIAFRVPDMISNVFPFRPYTILNEIFPSFLVQVVQRNWQDATAGLSQVSQMRAEGTLSRPT